MMTSLTLRSLPVGLAAFALGAFSFPAGSLAAEPAPDAFEARVRAYLVSHPEILTEMFDALRRKETAARIAPLRDDLEKPYVGAWLGANDGDIVVVEFLDYACPHCRATAPVVEQLVKVDPKVKVVFRQLPILGHDSEIAAVESLAAAEQNRFLLYHRALWSTIDAPDQAMRAKAAAAARLEGEKGPTPARTGEIDKNMAMANALKVSGTPTFVIGDTIVSGEPTLAELQATIKQTREGRKTVPPLQP